MNRSAYLLALPLTAMALFVGCGGSDDSSSESTADTGPTQTEKPADTGGTTTVSETLALAADPSGALAYDTDSLESKAGTVSVDFTNDAPIGHDVVFEQDGKEVARGDVITGGSENITFDAKAGDYTFYCSLPGHRAAGMEGTLTVK
ncbi:MAG: plastocyanin/azurin family copper-binding protein [Solirubrobacterales bacterium]